MQERIRYQDELDTTLGKEVVSASGVQDLYRCIQCGTCSSTCPLNIYMDYTPRKIIAMTRGGFRDEVLRSNSIWLCASCYACAVECPRKISITDIMYTLKRQAIEKQIYPKRFPIPVLAKEFFASVMKTGRANEGRTVTWMLLKTAPWRLFQQASLGLKLLLRGRLSVGKERLGGGVDQMRRLLDQVDAAQPKPPLS